MTLHKPTYELQAEVKKAVLSCDGADARGRKVTGDVPMHQVVTALRDAYWSDALCEKLVDSYDAGDLQGVIKRLVSKHPEIAADALSDDSNPKNNVSTYPTPQGEPTPKNPEWSLDFYLSYAVINRAPLTASELSKNGVVKRGSYRPTLFGAAIDGAVNYYWLANVDNRPWFSSPADEAFHEYVAKRVGIPADRVTKRVEVRQ